MLTKWHDIKNGPSSDYLLLSFRSELGEDIVVKAQPFRIVHHYVKKDGYETLKVRDFRVRSLKINYEEIKRFPLIIEGCCELYDYRSSYHRKYFIAEYNPTTKLGRIRFGEKLEED